MTDWQKIKFRLFVFFRFSLPEAVRSIRRRIWNKRIRLWWHKLFVKGRSEFHHSLAMDTEAMMVMDDEELRIYLEDLGRRRSIAHDRDIV
jgi:hypothetical protein